MYPVAFSLGPVAVATHDVFVLLGVLAGAGVFALEARRRGLLDERLVWVVLGALLCGALAGQLGKVVWAKVAVAPEAPVGVLLVTAGRSILSGLAGAYGGALLSKRLVGYRRSTGDLFAPAIAVGLAVGRVGCFLTEPVGDPTTLPWGWRVPAALAGRVPDCPGCLAGVAMHPAMLYEVVFHALAGVALRAGRDRLAHPGALLTRYLLAYALFRLALETVRGSPEVVAGMTGSQLLLLVPTLLLAGHVLRAWRRGSLAPAGSVPGP